MQGLLPSRNYFKCRLRAAKGYFKFYSVSKARAINISVNSQLSFLALISLQEPRRFPGKLEPAVRELLGEKEVGGCGVSLKWQRHFFAPWLSKLSALRKEAKCLGYKKHKNKTAESPGKYRLLRKTVNTEINAIY